MIGRAAPRDRRSAVKRKQIVDAATRAFLADGYARTSVDAIASAAGVGKQTVYSHFDGKRALFLEVVAQARLPHPREATLEVGHDAGSSDPEDELTRLVEVILGAALDPTVAALHRLTIAELAHHPELQEMWRDDQTFPEQDGLAGVLAAYHESGLLSVSDPGLVARQLVLLAVSEARVATLWGTRPLDRVTSEQIARRSAQLITAATRPTLARAAF